MVDVCDQRYVERRMPCIEDPHGDPRHRLELVTYARASADWICELLAEMARYPFSHRSGFAIGHTLPVTAKPGNLWSGYLILSPKLEPQSSTRWRSTWALATTGFSSQR